MARPNERPRTDEAATTIRGVIFDFGNVISAFDHRRFTGALARACGRPADELHSMIYERSTLPRAYESGAIGSAEFRAGVSALCGRDFPEADFIQAYTDIFTPIQTTLDLIRQLKPRYRLGLLSDTGPWHADHAIRTCEVYPLFDAVTLSFDVGAMKPDPRLFEDVLAKLDLPAGACVYIDDRPPFARAATEHGLHGIAYTGPEALMEELKLLGVTP